MRYRVLIVSALVAVLALPGAGVSPALAEPLAEQVAVDRAALQRATTAYEDAQARSAEIDARVAETVAALDAAIAEQTRCESYLAIRASALYRSGQESYLTMLFSATSIPELNERLDLLARVAEQDARTIGDLKAARMQAEGTAKSLLEDQAEQVRALEDLEAEVTRARAEFAASEAALKQYEEQRAAAAARAAAEAKRAAEARAARTPSAPAQSVTGSGEWKTGVASHYSKTFTGRSASGAAIGPYTMMVAHKTLPFGTLVEFEYRGKRAVASVEDRGPYVAGRDWDLGPGVVRALDFNGVHEVRYRIISR